MSEELLPTKCDDCGCEFAKIGQVFAVNLDCECECHAPLDLGFEAFCQEQSEL